MVHLCLPNLLHKKTFFFWYMRIYYYRAFVTKIYDLGLSFLPLYKGKSETLAILTTLKRIPEMSPTWHLQPNPATRTSSFSSIKFKQPSLGTKAGGFFWPFLISWTLTHFLMEEFGCLASTPIFSSTIPLAWKCRQKGWPSGLCPNGLSCTVCHATCGLVGEYGASWQHEDCNTCHPAGATGLSPQEKLLMCSVWESESPYTEICLWFYWTLPLMPLSGTWSLCLYSVFESVFESPREMAFLLRLQTSNQQAWGKLFHLEFIFSLTFAYTHQSRQNEKEGKYQLLVRL